MKHTLRKWLSGFLALIMLFSMMPVTALAALTDNSPAYNQEILDSLRQLYGSEEEAQAYYALLEKYGLLDETGDLAESWSIIMDGADVTLAEIRALLADPATDLEKLVVVDGTPISLGEIQTILEIEEYIAYLRTTYFDGHQWTQEQLANLESLVSQINESGIRILSADDTGVTSWPSGVSHDTRVVVEASEGSGTGTKIFVTVYGCIPGQKISFDWEAHSGTYNIAANEKGTVELVIPEDYSDKWYLESFVVTPGEQQYSKDNHISETVLSSDNMMFYVKLSNLKNAVFAESETGKTYGTSYSLAVKTEANVLPSGGIEYQFIPGFSVTAPKTPANDVKKDELYITEDSTTKAKSVGFGNIEETGLGHKEWYNFMWGIYDTIELTTDGVELEKKTAAGEKYSPGAGFYTYEGADTGLYGTGKEIVEKLSAQVPMTTEHTATFQPKKVTLRAEIDGILLHEKTYSYKKISGRDTLTKDTPLVYNAENPDTNTNALFEYSAVNNNKGISEQAASKWRDGFYLTGSVYHYDHYTVSTETATNPSNNLYDFPLTEKEAPGEYRITDLDVTAKFSITKPLEVESVTAVPGTYEYGHSVPVMLRFNRPVLTDSVSVRFGTDTTAYKPVAYEDNTDYQYVEASNVVVVMYPVKALDEATLSVSSISATDIAGHKLTDHNPGAASVGLKLDGVQMVTPRKTDAVTGISAKLGGTKLEPTMDITVTISADEKTAKWLAEDMAAQGDGTFVSQSLKLRLNGGESYPLVTSQASITGGTLTASIPLTVNTSDTETLQRMAELVMVENAQESLVMGRYAVVTQAPAVYITANDITLKLTANGNPITKAGETIYVQDEPKLAASYTLTSGKEFTYPEVAWSSNNTDIANIDKDGNIIPTGKAGNASFTLTASNGSIEGKAVSVETIALQFAAGLTPFLVIPGDTMQSVAGQDVTVYWSSNLQEKDPSVVFAVEAKRGTETIFEKDNVGETSITIPDSQLSYQYDNGGSNTITITVSAVYDGATYEDTTELTLVSQPAVVTLDDLSSYYLLDTAGTVGIGWKVKNFERFSTASSDTLFELAITSSKGNVVYSSTDPGAGTGGTYKASTSLTIPNLKASADDPNSYREVYTVTVKAKNGTDSTWSYDSFLLYVYDAEALEILVGGEPAAAVTLSNRDRIAEMTPEEIIALNRDIGLKEIISVNYGTYAWTELADQIQWSSSDNQVATINYQQNTLYDNIEDFTYVSYRPTTEFGLSGIADGTATITATHALTGMTEELTVTVETLKDRLYLFQCYPQTETTLTYVNGNGETISVKSNAQGAAAIYEPAGIDGNVYCKAEYDGGVWLGTFYKESIRSGEGDWTRLTRYPCNNLELRRAAYAYLYLKHPDGKPYMGQIHFRGGVYVKEFGVDGELVYQKEAKFGLNGDKAANRVGYEDQTVTLGSDGKLEIFMDQHQWGLTNGTLEANDKVEYIFEISLPGDDLSYYPLLAAIDATANEEAYVGTGEAVATFRQNPNADKGKYPFIAIQTFSYGGMIENVLDSTEKYGPGVHTDATTLNTMVMWWDEDGEPAESHDLQLYTDAGEAIGEWDGEYTISHNDYPFASFAISRYSVLLDKNTLFGILEKGCETGVYLDFYRNETLARREQLPFRLCNMVGVTSPVNSEGLLEQIRKMGEVMETDAKKTMNSNDQYVNVAMDLAAKREYTNGDSDLFRMRLAPTSDPTKFLGFVQVGLGEMGEEGQVSGTYLEDTKAGDSHMEYTPDLGDMLMLAGDKTPSRQLRDGYDNSMQGKANTDFDFTVGGYLETLIYYDFDTHAWEMQVLSGGFNAGAGLGFSWNWNMMVGPVPFTATLTIGGSGEVSMDVLNAAYTKNGETAIGTDYLTELRLYLYLRLFGGVGVDYAVITLKLGIYGQINLDMRFQWLNRPYLTDGATPVTNTIKNEELNGQNFKINGQIGLEFVFRFLFIEYEVILYSRNFKATEKSTGNWKDMQAVWEADKKAYQEMIDDLVSSGSISVQSVGGQQMLSLNLAPTLADNRYLDEGSYWNDGSFSLFALDTENGMQELNHNAYEYANPVVTDDGAIAVFLGIPAAYEEEGAGDKPVKAMFAVRNNNAYTNPGSIYEGEAGYGDSQLSVSGSEAFAVAAWTRQMVDIQHDADPVTGKQVLTANDQMMMMNGTDVFASVYTGGTWTTTRLTNGGGADLAPVTAANGSRAIVAWRSVTASSGDKITEFDSKDTILYKVYDGSTWSEAYTLYNGTSGNVKAIVAHMLDNGTAAVAYALDTDKDSASVSDREIAYAVIDKKNAETVRTVFPTKDQWLDENPQLTSVKFGENERFVLGWYTEQTAMQTGAAALNRAAEDPTAGTTVTADIRLLDFDETGTCTQHMPDSIDKAAAAYDVQITSNFRFVKNADTIDQLSILWVQRDEGTETALEYTDGTETSVENPDISSLATERDTLKGVQFYTYGQNNELISFTGAVDVAEMNDSTLIDFFDAYVSDKDKNEIKAVILGTTYGSSGLVEKTAETVGGELVSYQVPSRITSMYTATETYENKIDVPAFLPDYDTVKRGAKTEIWFNVENRGVDAITKLEIRIGNDTTVLDALNLLPGGTLDVYGDYTVPTEITDPTFSVTAAFADGSTYTYGVEEGQSNTIYLNLPDVEITEAKIVDETEGKRTIQVKLNNRADAALGDSSDTTVQLRFFSDAGCQTPIDSLAPVVIDETADLAMINDGGFSTQVVFDVTECIDAQTEIPENGMTVFIKAEVLDTKGELQGEPRSQNNFAAVTCENLRVRTGKDVSVSSDLTVDETSTVVTVSLQNNRLTKTSAGNVIVTLFDADGKVLAQSQSYDPDASDKALITLAGEEKAAVTFTFTEPGAYVQVSYTELELNEENEDTGLAYLQVDGIPGIDLNSFRDNGNGIYTAAAVVSNLTEVTVLAGTRNAYDVVKRTGSDEAGSNLYNGKVALLPGSVTTISLTVTNQKGTTEKTYVLTVQNGGEIETATLISSVEDRFAQYPAAIRNMYQDADALIEALMDKMASTGADDMEVYDIGMQFTVDGSEWIEATAGNFPAGGFIATIPYPDSARTNTHNFTLYRMIVDPLQTGKQAGAWEAVDFTLKEDGIYCLADCLAVYVLGWERKPVYLPRAYPVMLEKTDNGVLFTRTKHSFVGATVTLTATAKDGFIVEGIEVITEQGDTVMVLQKAEGLYTFIMPDDKVNVKLLLKSEE